MRGVSPGVVGEEIAAQPDKVSRQISRRLKVGHKAIEDIMVSSAGIS